jgi:branched-chain amino acid transport system ATP-binding protein
VKLQSEDLVLDVQDVISAYEDIQVLRGVTLSVREGEVVALFGPNGHGKSTLLKAISGLHPPLSGSIKYRGEELARAPSHEIVQRGVAYIAEERHLFTDMSVQENLTLGAYNSRARRTMAQNLDLVYEIFPRLQERRKQLCSTLSGGESRMVAIARGLMGGASLLLLDEPSIGLAPGLKKVVYRSIRTINEQAEITILLVEQEIEHALGMANRVYLLKKGSVLFERPASEADAAEIKEAYF